MPLGPNEVKTAVIMCKRAQCSGEESLAVAQTIIALEQLLQALMEEAQAKDKKTNEEKKGTPPADKQPRKKRGK